MPIQVLDIKPYSPLLPFTVMAWTGDPKAGAAARMKNPYFVSMGIVLSTFSYATGTFIQVKKTAAKSYGLNEPFDFQANHKVYLEFTVLPNLQISGNTASIYCERVGSPDPNAVKELYPMNWPSYPDLIHTEPKDIYDQQGKIKILKNGKRQGKAYALLAYRSDDDEQDGQTYNQEGNSDNLGSQTGNTGVGSFVPIQSCNSDIILMHTAVNGVPCAVPMPYFNATNHYRAVTSVSVTSVF
jgi:hypothetical protein